MTDFCKEPGLALEAVRERTPLIHNITNYVVMNYTANALLALGAAPVMAHAPNEVEEMVSMAGALVLNIGTLEDAWIESMLRAGRQANAKGVPIILDPVGAGATRLRTEACVRILTELQVRAIRGNASEVLALGGAATGARGVDAVNSVDEAAVVASKLAKELHTVLAITGAVDLVTDGDREARISNGHPLMAKVTGTGCTSTAICGAFLAVVDQPLDAMAAGLAYMGLAGERAAQKHSAPGSFMIGLLDALYELQPENLKAGAQIACS